MLFSLMLIAAAQHAAIRSSIDLNSSDTIILTKGLERELNGKFLLVGLTKADRACRITSACLGREQFRQNVSGNAADVEATNIETLLSSTRVDDKALRYVVAVRAIQEPTNSTGLKIIMSVFDAEQRRWRLATANVSPTPAVVQQPMMIYSRTFQSFRYQPD